MRYETARLADFSVLRGEERRKGFDRSFFTLVLLLLLLGVIMVLSASFARSYYTTGNPVYYFARQMLFAVSGVALMLIVSRIKVSTFRRFAYPLLAVSLLLLVIILSMVTLVHGLVLLTKWFSLLEAIRFVLRKSW